MSELDDILKENNLDTIVSDVQADVVYKYITFYLGNELLGFDILRVREIYRMPAITFVPNAPSFIKGVINLRGKVIPVISLRIKLDLSENEYDLNTKIIVVFDENDNEVGVIVDKIGIATEVPIAIVEPPPATMNDIEGSFLKGIAKLNNGQLLVMLNLDKILENAKKVEIK